MPAERLSPQQRKILVLLKEHGSARFGQGTRNGFWTTITPTGLIIFAYSHPQWFLAKRGLIEDFGIPARYRLTAKGLSTASKIR